MRDHCRAGNMRTGGAQANRCMVVLLVLLAAPGMARPQELAPAQRRAGDPYAISVNVDVVGLHATVRARSGSPVSGLGKEDFQVYEDGIPQQIQTFSSDDMPVTVGLVVDGSGSMRTKRLEVIVAALAFVHSSNPADEMFVVSFNEKVSFGLPDDTPFTNDAVQLKAALSRTDARGMTALYDAVAAALEHLKMGHRDKKVLIVVSDGADNASRHDLDEVVAMAGQSDAIIYTMGLFEAGDSDRNPRALKRLARNTGGEAFLPESITDVRPICERIARDVRSQYAITYVPTNKKRDGTYRAIRVRATTPGQRLSTRTRAGYYAPLNPRPSPVERTTP